MILNGVLVVDKPAGPTSHDVVAEARRALKIHRIGHTGTLDPSATGVLALVLGQATRLSRFMTGDVKGYEAVVHLGVQTDTYDSTGTIEREARELAAAVTGDELERALEGFRGTFAQVPPRFSAKKVDGTRAYALARRQKAVVLAPAKVTVSRLELVTRDASRLTLRVEATTGFYVRSLAHDLGERLGCGAHLAALRRYRSGSFTLDRAVGLSALREDPAAALARIVPLEALLPELPAFVLTDGGERRALHGNPVGPADARAEAGSVLPASGGFARLFSGDRRLLAVGRTGPDRLLHPVVVLN